MCSLKRAKFELFSCRVNLFFSLSCTSSQSKSKSHLLCSNPGLSALAKLRETQTSLTIESIWRPIESFAFSPSYFSSLRATFALKPQLELKSELSRAELQSGPSFSLSFPSRFPPTSFDFAPSQSQSQS